MSVVSILANGKVYVSETNRIAALASVIASKDKPGRRSILSRSHYNFIQQNPPMQLNVFEKQEFNFSSLSPVQKQFTLSPPIELRLEPLLGRGDTEFIRFD